MRYAAELLRRFLESLDLLAELGLFSLLPAEYVVDISHRGTS
jgi:hypothetical protein